MKNQDQEQPATKSKQILSDWNNPEFIKEITELISNKKSRKLKSILEESHPADIAEALGAINIENAIYLFRLCDEETRGLILVEMTEELQSIFVEKLNLKEISPIIGNMESDEATSLISEISEEKAEEILNSIDKEDSSKIRSQLNFNENTAGRLMSKDYAVVQENETARKGIINLRKASRETENIYVVYVTDENGILKGYVKLKDLFLASPTARISRIMIPSVKALHYDLDQEEVAR
ncbi:MAG: magnesium transporter, partial [Leptospira sp.]|nr:magnesium transporter [Leptospira sp.]